MNMKGFSLDRQLDIMDCGPASLKMVAKYYKMYYSLQYLRDLCGSTLEETVQAILNIFDEARNKATAEQKTTQ